MKLSTLILFAGLTLCILTAVRLSKSHKLLRTGVIYEGKVIQLTKKKNKPSSRAIHPVIEYTDQNKNVVSFTTKVGYSSTPYSTGQKIKIIANSNDRRIYRFVYVYGLEIIAFMTGALLVLSSIMYKYDEELLRFIHNIPDR